MQYCNNSLAVSDEENNAHERAVGWTSQRVDILGKINEPTSRKAIMVIINFHQDANFAIFSICQFSNQDHAQKNSKNG